ncbi:MAG: DUF1501 domain-containing protein [Luminiphilus sp.]
MTRLRKNTQGGLSRRQVLRAAALGGSTLAGLMSSRVWGNSTKEPYAGKLLVTMQLDGGVDVTQLCDPKTNVRGEPKINRWADQLEPDQAGNIYFAPVANNFEFFDRFGRDMLVINGVDSQTNSHETGKLYNWTGSNAEGKPSLSALFAAAQSPDQPLAYSVFEGFSRTAGLIGYNRFDNLSNIGALIQPNVDPWSGNFKRAESDVVRSQNLVRDGIEALLTQPGMSARQRQSVLRFVEARESREGLQRLAELIPTEENIMPREELNAGGMNFSSSLKQQMQGALLVFKSGLGSAADLSLGGFDSHEDHDVVSEALLSHFAGAVQFFWNYAEELGISDRITLVIGSDFSRTNFYNDGNGKDHWPIGSYMVMEQGAPWGDRVVGLTDELHFAKAIDPETLKESPQGVLMTPSHIHKALQQYLGLDALASDAGFELRDVESVSLFDPFVMSS